MTGADVRFLPNFVRFASKSRHSQRGRELSVWPEVAIRIFRLTCLGALFHVLLLITTLVLLYFDLRRQAMLSCLLFLVLNAAGALATLQIGVQSYGLGYALAALIGLVVSFRFLTHGPNELDYQTFTTQARVLEP